MKNDNAIHDANKKIIDLHDKQTGVAEKLGIEDIDPLEVTGHETTFHDNQDDDVKDDYQFIRKRLRYVVCAGSAVLDEALKEIRTDISPRTIEGCSTLLKTIVESSKELLAIHEKIKKIKIIQPPNTPIAEGEDTESKDGKPVPPKLQTKLQDILDELQIQNDTSSNTAESTKE